MILELGGKDPLIILDDAEMDQAIQVALRGAFVNCGQNCIAAERIYVQEGNNCQRNISMLNRTQAYTTNLWMWQQRSFAISSKVLHAKVATAPYSYTNEVLITWGINRWLL